MVYSLIALQVFVVIFVAFHDWVQIGALNDVKAARAADPTSKLVTVTVLSTLPFAIGLWGTIEHAATRFPAWLMWWLWISYGVAAYGMARTWWGPYLLFKDAARAERYKMFAHTHAFLPVRNGIRPNTLHVILHVVVLAILVLLSVATFSRR